VERLKTLRSLDNKRCRQNHAVSTSLSNVLNETLQETVRSGSAGFANSRLKFLSDNIYDHPDSPLQTICFDGCREIRCIVLVVLEAAWSLEPSPCRLSLITQGAVAESPSALSRTPLLTRVCADLSYLGAAHVIVSKRPHADLSKIQFTKTPIAGGNRPDFEFVWNDQH